MTPRQLTYTALKVLAIGVIQKPREPYKVIQCAELSDENRSYLLSDDESKVCVPVISQ
eukprot:CAMPEP_0170071874 /NCGR_PEP_ID=MMETSP0019_2-20121128/9669_1 /TAXON_ID=98059 /ORGANISM="Dinobryon sp., Strain UTEXLB2267" /LENGTH=57 /DNA_ID=CAMNT_0010280595 /DNA_START=543 /DNA_END=716 /DNA_ORIENTATION=+